MPERNLVRELLRTYGSLPGTFIYRVNVVRRGRVLSVPVGHADLIMVRGDGRVFYIECKSPTGRQSPAQRAFQSAVERAGATYILAGSVQDVADIL